MLKKIILCFCGFIISVNCDIVTLLDGNIIDGQIVSYTEKEVTIKSFDGREWTLSWKFIHPECKNNIQSRLGLIESESTIDLIDGVVIYLKTGGTVRGKLVSRSSQKILIKNKTGQIPIPTSNIVTIEKKQIKITSMYSIDEIYENYAPKYNFDNAKEQWNFGIFLRDIGSEDKAKKHIARALELSSEYRERAEKLLNEVEALSQKEQEQKLVQKLQLYMSSRRFEEAEELLNELSFLPENEKKDYLEKINSVQQKSYEKNVAQLWLDKIFSQTTSLSLDRKISMEEAKEKLLQEEQKIMAEVAEKFSLTEDQVKEYFEKRNLRRTYKFNYARGTFSAGLGNNREKVENYSKLEPLLQGQKGRISGKKLTSDEWWQKESSSRKKEWLQAFYAEKRLSIISEKWKVCPQCSAKGFIKNGRNSIFCPTCQGIKFERTIIAK